MSPTDQPIPVEDAVLARCTNAADRIPLIHVTSGRAGRPMLWEIADGTIPTSAREHNYCGDGARFAEEKAGWPPSVYFYAGRANPRYGQTALAFGPEVEAGRLDSATPFDSGSVVRQDLGQALNLRLGLPADATNEQQLRARVEYCGRAAVGDNWRAAFARWLALHFPSGVEGYWERRPEVPDPEGLYERNPDGDWAAWTWEVRFTVGPKVTDAIRWSADPTHLAEFRQRIPDAGYAPEVADELDRFMSNLETPTGSVTYCEDLESWVRRQLGLMTSTHPTSK